MPHIELTRVIKIFGPSATRALEKLRAGKSKADILAETGCAVALNDVSLQIEPGEIFVVMGLSGCGKSTLLRLINRLVEPTAGGVAVDGEDILALGDVELRALRRQKMSMVFQNFALFPHKTVLDNVAYGLRVAGMARAPARERARDWVKTVALDGYEGAYPAALSGGMQQRVGLARALATEPEILLMDEPFSALDPLTRRDMQDELLGLERRLNKTLVFVTHDLDEALRLGDRIAILGDGSIIQLGTPEEILHAPANDYVRAFVATLPDGYQVRRPADPARASGGLKREVRE